MTVSNLKIIYRDPKALVAYGREFAHSRLGC